MHSPDLTGAPLGCSPPSLPSRSSAPWSSPGSPAAFGGDDPSGGGRPRRRVVTTTSAPPIVETVPTTAPIARRRWPQTLGEGSYGDDVHVVQNRLKELGFDPGPIDGQFGGLTRAAVWAFEKLVLQTPATRRPAR